MTTKAMKRFYEKVALGWLIICTGIFSTTAELWIQYPSPQAITGLSAIGGRMFGSFAVYALIDQDK